MISRDVLYWPVMNISRDVRSAEENPGAPCCFTQFHMSMYWLCVRALVRTLVRMFVCACLRECVRVPIAYALRTCVYVSVFVRV